MPEGVGYGPNYSASTGLELNVVGRHCYANSGPLTSNNSSQTFLNFNTGSFYVVGHLTVTAPVKEGEPSNGRVIAYAMTYNGVIVYTTKCESITENQPVTDRTPILIPPYTSVVVTGTADTTASLFFSTAQIIGKINK